MVSSMEEPRPRPARIALALTLLVAAFAAVIIALVAFAGLVERATTPNDLEPWNHCTQEQRDSGACRD